MICATIVPCHEVEPWSLRLHYALGCLLVSHLVYFLAVQMEQNNLRALRRQSPKPTGILIRSRSPRFVDSYQKSSNGRCDMTWTTCHPTPVIIFCNRIRSSLATSRLYMMESNPHRLAYYDQVTSVLLTVQFFNYNRVVDFSQPVAVSWLAADTGVRNDRLHMWSLCSGELHKL